MQCLWAISVLPAVATAAVVAFLRLAPRQDSKAELIAVLMQAQQFLNEADWFEDHSPRDHQAMMMLNYLLGHKDVSEDAKKIIAHIRTGMQNQVGNPADDMTRYMWAESINSARAVL